MLREQDFGGILVLAETCFASRFTDSICAALGSQTCEPRVSWVTAFMTCRFPSIKTTVIPTFFWTPSEDLW
jgi:hypothetical protein